MNRLVNGKNLVTIIDELSAPFDKALFKDNQAGFSYLPYEVYLNRMDDVVGILNYDFEVSDTVWVTLGDKYHVSTVGKLTIRDDEGKVVAIKSATGDADVICKRETGEAVKPGNDSKIAAHDAFKGCCRMFGMGDEQLRDMRKNKNGGNRSASSAKAASNAATNTGTANEETFRVLLDGSFSSMSNGSGYKAPVVLPDTGEKVLLVIFKEGIDAILQHVTLQKFFEYYKKGTEFSVVGYRTSFTFKNGRTEEQVVMLRPVNRKEAC